VERFVYGFVVSTDALWDLVGSGLDASELLRGVDNEFIDMFEDEFESEPGLTRYAEDVLSGRLDPDRAYPYTRLVEPILTMVAEPLGMIHMAYTCYLPNDSFGRWNPVLAAIGLPRLAAAWAEPNCPFPWPRGSKARSDWPCVTELAAGELARSRPSWTPGGATRWRRCPTRHWPTTPIRGRPPGPGPSSPRTSPN
jgi:hypothetical protein